MQEHKAQLTQKNTLAPHIVELRLELESPKSFVFRAGQYVQLLTEYTFRAYSIVNPPVVPNPSSLTLCVKLIPDGIASEYIQALNVGDTVRFRGPLGNFTIRDLGRPILFVATSVGLAPILSHIQWLGSSGSTAPMHLLFGVRHEADIFYADILERFALEHKLFQYTLTLSNPGSSWKGGKGRVTEHVKEYINTHQDYHVYICGSQGMVTDVRDILITGGVLPESIFQEIFV